MWVRGRVRVKVWEWLSVFGKVFVELEKHDLKQEHTYTKTKRGQVQLDTTIE